MNLTQSRLQQISLLFPEGTSETDEFFSHLTRLLNEVPSSSLEGNGLIIQPSTPARALPALAVRTTGVSFPTIVFDTTEPINLSIGNLLLHSSATMGKRDTSAMSEPVNDNTRLTLSAIYQQLQRHIVRLDHVGVNIPVTLVNRETWDNLVNQVARVSNLYRYPTDEAWPFILPSTDEEFQNDIEQFTAGREPKFELVYDEHAQEPIIQIDVETNLSRQELETLFPEPYGNAFPGVADYFRSLFVAHPWPSLSIRLDLRYRSEGEPNVWDTGEWLVKDGGRIQ